MASSYSPTTWAEELLRRLGFRATPANVSAVVAWEAAEGGHWHNSAYYNPLNTTENAPGATSMNSVGVKAYTSWGQGFDATVQTLRNGRYGPILAALQSGRSAVDVARGVAATPWGTGTGVLKALGQHYAPSGPSAPPAPSSSGDGTATATPADHVFPGGGWDPLNWLADPLQSGAEKAAGVLVGGLERFLFTGAGLGLGVALIVIGAWRGFAPARQKVETTVTNIAKAAEVPA